MSCSVTGGGVRVATGTPEYLALKLCQGMLQYEDELKKLDIEKQLQVQEAKKKLESAGFVQGYKLTQKGEVALQYLEECKMT
jgi:hypothetical protein